MKRVISLFICVLMCFSFFTATVSQVYAVGNAAQIFSVTTDGFSDDEITFKVVLSAGQENLTGAVLDVAFDSTALQVVEAGAVGSLNEDGDFVENISGLYETGLKHDNESVLAFAYTHATGYTSSSAKEMFYVTFKAISSERRPTSVEFACVEYITADGDDSNNIAKNDGIQSITTKTFDTLSQPEVKEVNSVADGLSVVWSASVGAENYTLYRKTEGSEWVALDVIIDGASNEYTDTTIAQGTEYYYTVSAANSYTETDYNKTGVAGMNFGSISSIEATTLSTGIKITWSALAGAEKYEILRKLSSSDNWQKVTSTNACEYVDESVASGVYYDYRVRAIQGKYSAGLAVDPATAKFIATPVVYVCNANGGVDVSFDEVGGAAKYIIERSVNGSAFAVVGEVADASGYFDEDVVENNSYSYRVQAVAEDGLVSAKATTQAIVRLGMPSDISVSNTSAGVKLTWGAVQGADEYEVFVKLGENSWNSVAVVTNTTYTDASVESGKGYLYAVSAKNETGESGFDEASYIYYLAEPGIASVSNIASGIQVVWNQVDGAEEYYIYRAYVNSTSWEKIASATGDSYIDTETEHGVYYKYAVAAVKGSNKSTYNKNGVEGMYFGTITEISAVPDENGAVITWGALEKATSYKVFRKTADDAEWTEVAEVTTDYYKDSGIASGVRYYYMVKAYSGNNVAETTADAAVVKYIAAPDSIVKNVSAGISITVTPVGGADTYTIYRDGKLIATLTDGNKVYVDTDVEPYGEYSYTVYASAGNVTSMGKETATITRLGAPKDIKLSNVIPGIKVTWSPVDDAVLYEIYRKEGSQKNWEKIAEVSGTSYTDGTVFGDEYYKYTVSAVTSDGGNSGYDDDGAEGYFLETPDPKSVTNVSGGLKFTWDGVDGATSYIVYRRQGGTKKWVNLGTVTGTSYTDKKVPKSGKDWVYTVRAKNGTYTSYFDSGVYTMYLSVPAVKSVSNVSNGLKVSWNKVEGATLYRIYRKTKTGSWKKVKDVSASTTSYTDTAVNKSAGKDYAYTVKAYNSKREVWSSNKSSSLVRRLLTPSLKSATSAKSGITLKWGKVTGASGYIVYRKTGNGSWKRMATVKGNSKVTYLDKSAKKGVTYKYTVKAYYSKSTSYYNTKGISCKDRY